jgi:hypothetical protein
MIAFTIDPLFEASAAEVFASSLHDNGRAALVGTKTFGKGLIQHTFPMPDGYVVRLGVIKREMQALTGFLALCGCGCWRVLSGRYII